MNETQQQSILRHWAATRNPVAHRFFTTDPRGADGLVPGWETGQRYWFPYAKQGEVTVWLDCGYGTYALCVKDECVGIGREFVSGAGWLYLGETYTESGLYRRVGI